MSPRQLKANRRNVLRPSAPKARQGKAREERLRASHRDVNTWPIKQNTGERRMEEKR